MRYGLKNVPLGAVSCDLGALLDPLRAREVMAEWVEIAATSGSVVTLYDTEKARIRVTMGEKVLSDEDNWDGLLFTAPQGCLCVEVDSASKECSYQTLDETVFGMLAGQRGSGRAYFGVWDGATVVTHEARLLVGTLLKKRSPSMVQVRKKSRGGPQVSLCLTLPPSEISSEDWEELS